MAKYNLKPTKVQKTLGIIWSLDLSCWVGWTFPDLWSSVLDLSWTGIVFPQKGHITPEDFSKCSALKWLILRNANLVGDDGVELSSQLEGSLHALRVLII